MSRIPWKKLLLALATAVLAAWMVGYLAGVLVQIVFCKMAGGKFCEGVFRFGSHAGRAPPIFAESATAPDGTNRAKT